MNPHALAATGDLEASILGAILVRPEILTELPRLELEDFADGKHHAVFTAMRNLEAANIPIDVVTVEAEIAKWAGHHDAITMAYLGTLALDVPSTDNVLEYARQVRQASLARRVSRGLSSVLERGMKTAMDGGEMLSSAFAVLASIDEDQPDSATSISSLASKRFRQLEQIAQERAKGGTTMTGFPTGVVSLDEKIGGIQPGIVTIVAARPGMGKSSLGLSIADACSAGGFGVHVFSLEDTEESYSDRTLSRVSQVPAESMRNADLSVKQCGDITMTMHKLKGRRWIVDGRSGITAEEIVRSVRRHRRQNATNVVIVDYVQLVKRPSRMSPHEALSEIVTTLADAAKQDRLAYVVMSQLNRQIEQRQDKRPQLSDLRESGSLEERSKCVIGLYRGVYYGEPTKGIDYDPKWQGHAYQPEGDEWASMAQLCVLKNSNGRTGTVWCTWNGPTTRIS
jgi:replicative DNA helicase